MEESQERVMPSWPRRAADLRAWLSEAAGLEFGESAMEPGHAAPFEYLVHAFYEGGGLLDADDPAFSQMPTVDAVVWANRGGGKTFLGAVATLADLVFKPGIEVRILGGSLEQSKRMHAHLRSLLDRPQFAWMVDGKITDRRVRLYNGSSVELLAQSQTSVRGTRVQKLRCDEIELFDPDVWEAAQLVTRSITVDAVGRGPTLVRGSVEALSTMHRPYGLMQKVVDEAASGSRRLFRWGVLDVLERCELECHSDAGDCDLWIECAGRAHRPEQAGHVRVEDAIGLKGRVGEASWEAEMLCRRPQRSDCVLPEFDVRVHVVDRDPSPASDLPGSGELPWVCGMDFGFRSPTVVLWAQVDASGVLWVQAERVEAEVVLDEHIDAIRRGPMTQSYGPPAAPLWVGVDPAGRQRSDQTGVSAVSAMRSAGLRVRDKRVRMAQGLNLLRARLRPAAGGGPRMFVHRRCARLIECLERYHYPQDPRSLEPVKDGHDHAVDALRYLVQNLDSGFATKSGSYIG